MREALAAYWKDVVDNPDSHAVLYDITMTAYYDPDLRELGTFQYAEYRKVARMILELGIAETGYEWDTDVDTLAVGLVGLLDGLTLQYLVDRDNPAHERALHAYGKFLLGHLRPVPN